MNAVVKLLLAGFFWAKRGNIKLPGWPPWWRPFMLFLPSNISHLTLFNPSSRPVFSPTANRVSMLGKALPRTALIKPPCYTIFFFTVSRYQVYRLTLQIVMPILAMTLGVRSDRSFNRPKILLSAIFLHKMFCLTRLLSRSLLGQHGYKPSKRGPFPP